MTPPAHALALCALQLSGADRVVRPGRATGEAPLDAVAVSLTAEADPVPRFVLRSEFVLLLRTELRSRGAPDALHVEVDPVNTSAPILEQLAAEVVVVREAERAALGDADATEVASARAYLLDRIGGEAGLQELLGATGTTAAEFDALVRRRVVALHYLVARRAQLIAPTAQDLRARWEAERRRAPDQTPETFAAAREALEEAMVREAYPRALRQYLRSLGTRVRVRMFVDAAAP